MEALNTVHVHAIIHIHTFGVDSLNNRTNNMFTNVIRRFKHQKDKYLDSFIHVQKYEYNQ